MLERLFRSRAEVSILSIVLFSDNLHLREISRRASVSPYETKRELDILAGLGLLITEKKGNMVLYRLNTDCPFTSDLRSLYTKTEGIAGVLKEKLSKIMDVKYAFLFGSFANQSFSGKSDIDVLIVGDADEDEVARTCLELQKTAGREINYILWSSRDFKDKLKKKGAFIKSILANKTVWITGDEHEFKRVASKTLG